MLSFDGSQSYHERDAFVENPLNATLWQTMEPVMISQADLERCSQFINCQLDTRRSRAPAQSKLAVTLSRETGTGGRVIARMLADYLSSSGPNRQCPWTVFDRNLVERMIEDEQLPRDLARYMPEDRVSQLDDIVEELFGLHPSSWTLVRRLSQTMIKLAELGNVILVGRAANLVARLPHVFHVRLVGSLDRRIERLCHHDKLDVKAARETILQSDHARERYVRQNFGKPIDDPLLYDLVLNTDRLEDVQAARLIGDAALSLCSKAAMAAAPAQAA
jgi:cytidylate kinase